MSKYRSKGETVALLLAEWRAMTGLSSEKSNCARNERLNFLSRFDVVNMADE